MHGRGVSLSSFYHDVCALSFQLFLLLDWFSWLGRVAISIFGVLWHISNFLLATEARSCLLICIGDREELLFMNLLFSISIAYVIGALPLQGRLFRYRIGGNRRIYAMIIGMVKGVLATLLALLLGKWFAASFAAIFVVLGSMYSVFRGFSGDGGVAVATGALLVLSPLLFLIGVAIFLILLLVTRYFDLSTLIATVVVMIVAIFFVQHVYVWVGTICVGVLVLFNQEIDWNHIKEGWNRSSHLKK